MNIDVLILIISIIAIIVGVLDTIYSLILGDADDDSEALFMESLFCGILIGLGVLGLVGSLHSLMI
jgi:hypothetical protein